MTIVDDAGAPPRRAPLPAGPTVRPLLGPDSGAPVAGLHVPMPAAGCLPEHDHGPSHAALIPLHGQVRVAPRRHQHNLRPATATHIGVGERQHPHPGADHAELLVVAAPPDFA